MYSDFEGPVRKYVVFLSEKPRPLSVNDSQVVAAATGYLSDADVESSAAC